MKRLLYISALLLLVVFAACKKETLEHSSDYFASYNTWQNFKAACNNSYSYQVDIGSVFGYSSQTDIMVKAGKITGRSFVAKMIRYDSASAGPVTILTSQWTEDESQLGTHSNGAALLTMDDIYTKARTDWLVKRDNAKTYFETRNNGMISSCGYVPDGCMDDCFMGINITWIKAL